MRTVACAGRAAAVVVVDVIARRGEGGAETATNPMKLRSVVLPDFVEPMKAKLVAARPAGDWNYEIKFDGYRALALGDGSETRVLSRDEKDLGKKFPEEDSIAALDVQDAIIDYAACGIMLCRIPFYAAPSKDFPLARRSSVRHKNGSSARRSSAFRGCRQSASRTDCGFRR